MNFTFTVLPNGDAKLREIDDQIAEKINELEDLVRAAQEKLYIQLRLDLNDEEFRAFISMRDANDG